ncbi:MAG TPA: branched-chain amino acid ABC transporter permease [Nitrososphaerales archaeon]|nr:branched-chain amino acid ABC transporter permease [Nitrososphaerales archaeon]
MEEEEKGKAKKEEEKATAPGQNRTFGTEERSADVGARFGLLGKVSFRTARFYLIGVCVIMFALAPVITRNSYYLGTLSTIALYGVLAMSWDILSGYTGYLNFGIAFSFGVGGYAAALVGVHTALPPSMGIFLGGLASVLFGFIVGAPSLRLRGHFFILVTLLVPLATAALLQVLLVDGSIFGVNQIVTNQAYTYEASVAVFALTGVVLYVVSNSNIGLIFRAIRENEIAAEASGIHTGSYKILAFSISGFFAGMAGALYVYANGVASPTMFGILLSAPPVFMAALGGMGTIAGPILGAFLLEGSLDFFRINIISDARLLIAAVLLFVVLLFFPEGIWGAVSSWGQRRRRHKKS